MIRPRLRTFAILTLLVLYVARNVAVTLWYGAASLDWTGAMTELPYWTGAHATSQLQSLQRRRLPGSIISDGAFSNVVRFEGGSLKGQPILFFPLEFNFDPSYDIGDTWGVPLRNAEFRAALEKEVLAHRRAYGPQLQLRAPHAARRPFDRFFVDTRIEQAAAKPDRSLVLKSFNPTLFNNWMQPGRPSERFLLQPYGSTNNFLIYLLSARSDYDTPPRFESDVFDPRREIEGVGRYLLFNVVKPSKNLRVELDFTESLQGDGVNSLPSACVLGVRRVCFDLVGRGSARSFSPVVTPQVVRGLAFLEIDMGRDGKAFPDQRRGLLALYGKEYPVDRRRVVGFIRDISAVSDAEYRDRRVPAVLSDLVRQLKDPGLEYSGLYEDGWTSDAFVVRLSAKRPATLHVAGFVPLIADKDFTTHMNISVDGRAVSRAVLKVGGLNVRVPRVFAPGIHRIQIRLDRSQRFGAGDNRVVGLHLSSVGFEGVSADRPRQR